MMFMICLTDSFCFVSLIVKVDTEPYNFTLRENCPYLGFFWSAFSRIRTEYGEILRISSYSFRMRENTDQKNSEYEHFLRSVMVIESCNFLVNLW